MHQRTREALVDLANVHETAFVAISDELKRLNPEERNKATQLALQINNQLQHLKLVLNPPKPGEAVPEQAQPAWQPTPYNPSW